MGGQDTVRWEQWKARIPQPIADRDPPTQEQWKPIVSTRQRMRQLRIQHVGSNEAGIALKYA